MPRASLTAVILGSLSLWGAHPGPQWAPAGFPLPTGPRPGPRPWPAPQPDRPRPQQASGIRLLRGAGDPQPQGSAAQPAGPAVHLGFSGQRPAGGNPGQRGQESE
ncbi:unnamed protein product, partial [Gulo gulo]